MDITPPLGLTMYGFDSRTGGATGVRDPLMARVLVLEVDQKRLALVVLDLGEPPAPAWDRAAARGRREEERCIDGAGHRHAHPFGSLHSR